MAEGIIKDIRGIHSSIFDPKPLIKKEVEYFVREFEEKRGDREVDHLFSVLEKVSTLKDSDLPKAAALADIHLPKFSAELQVAESISQKLLQRAAELEKNSATGIERKKEERAAEWDAFVHEMTEKCIRIDNTYKEKQAELRELYKQLDEKLTSGGSK